MKKSLKVLMVLHMPWERNLGGSRVQLELAEELRALGHEVEKYDYNDAFPQALPSKFSQIIQANFSGKVKKYVKRNAHRFDIIDAHQGNLPFTKQELGFQGLLVARSVGLYAFYEDFARSEAAKWPSSAKGTPPGRLLKRWRERCERPSFLRSLQTCDIINVCNQDEAHYVRDVLSLGHKCIVLPFGLTQQRQNAFACTALPVEVRWKKKQVVFIGYWTPRKGSLDWAAIVAKTHALNTNVQFLFLGTGVSAEVVQRDLGIPACDWIKIVPKFASEDLPQLLSEGTVGAFPSYIEGFPFAMLEKLASGIPTVAYNVPGPRETLRLFSDSMLVPPGDTTAMAEKILALLCLPLPQYESRSCEAMSIANQFLWLEITKKMLDVYGENIARIRQDALL